MVKYKFTLVLLFFFAVSIGLSAMYMGVDGEIGIYNPDIIAGAVIVIPVINISKSLTDLGLIL